MNKLQKLMKERNVSIRDIVKATGVNLSLTCYVTRGLAHFENIDDLLKTCELLQCKPEDIYSLSALKVFYPQYKVIREKKIRYGNPSVRVREDLVERIKGSGDDVAVVVNAAIEQYLSAKEKDIDSQNSKTE